MQKIISLFKRDYEGTRLVYNEVVPGAEWVLNGEGVATVKWDGTCCMVRDGVLYKRYDAKHGKQPPANFEPAQDTEYHCVSCLCVVQYPYNSALGSQEHATQNTRAEASLRTGVEAQANRVRSDLQVANQRESEHPQPGMRAVSDSVQGAQGEAVLLDQVRNGLAVGEWEQAGQGAGAGEAQEDQKRKGIRLSLSAGASEQRQERICVRASVGDGEAFGAGSTALGAGTSSERNQGRQPGRKFGDRDARNAPWVDYLSTLRDGISTALTCPNCSGPVTKYVIPDPKTGHWPGWVPVGDGPADQWAREAVAPDSPANCGLLDGTYELVGPKVQGNPYGLTSHHLWRHGSERIPDPPRTFAELRMYLEMFKAEGIVYHHPDGRMVKIKRRDFGLPWPVKA